MDHLANFLFWTGVVGWLLALFALDLMSSKSLGGALLQTFVCVLVFLDAIASLLGMRTHPFRWADVGWKFVCFFFVAPYALSVLRLYWWHRRRQRFKPGAPDSAAK